MNFLRLRADQHAQYEIRVYADIMLDTLKSWYQSLMKHLWTIELEQKYLQRKINSSKIN